MLKSKNLKQELDFFKKEAHNEHTLAGDRPKFKGFKATSKSSLKTKKEVKNVRFEKREGNNGVIRAIVSNVLGHGRDRYAVTHPEKELSSLSKGETITFSLMDWDGSKEPLKGQIVVLSEIEKFARGWRARQARPVIFSEEGEAEKKKGERK